MGRLVLALKTFFSILGDAELATRVQDLQGNAASGPAKLPEAKPVEVTKPVPPPPPKPTGRSDALSLLESLQREARFLDFLQEDIAAYSDPQIGSAAREVHRGCCRVIQRMFEISPVLDEQEGASFEVTADESAARVHLVGNVSDRRPLSGSIVHAGWEARKVDLPLWTGEEQHARILAPAEVEIP